MTKTEVYEPPVVIVLGAVSTATMGPFPGKGNASADSVERYS